MLDILLQTLFWLCALLLVYTFVGYPLVVALLARLFPRGICEGGMDYRPRVSVVVVVRNGEDRIEARVRNLLDADYPPDSLEVIIVSDGSTDRTQEILEGIEDPRLRVIDREAQYGKASGLNVALGTAAGEIVVMGDARQQFAPDAIRAFVRPFADSSVGAVCGSLEVVSGGDSVSGGVSAHWKVENFVRRQEAAIDSSIGYTGAICAIRRVAFSPIPEDTILDDVVIPMMITQKGYRVVYQTAARGHDPQPFAQDIERVRKRRTMAGNFQMLFRYPEWLLPWRNRLWWQLISHKYLRLLGFPMMLSVLCSNVLLLANPLYGLLFLGQSCFYILAGIGLVFPCLRWRIVSLPASFVFVNWRTMIGLWDYLMGGARRGWERAS